MAIALIDHNTGAQAPGANLSASNAINSAGASLLILIVSTLANTPVFTVSDSKGNIWTLLTSTLNGAAALSQWVFYSVPTSVGSAHTAGVDNGAGGGIACSFSAWSGTAASSPADNFNAGNSADVAVTSQAPGSVTPSVGNCLVIESFGHGNADITGLSENSGVLTTLDSVVRLAGNWGACYTKYVIQTAAAAVNPTWSWTTSAKASAAAAAFKASATDVLLGQAVL